MKVKYFIIFLLLCLTSNVFAHEHLNSGAEEWQPVSAGPVTTWTAPLCKKGKFIIQPFFFYNHIRGVFDASGNYKSLQEGQAKHQYQEQLFMQYGITDKFEVDAQTVYQQNYVKNEQGKAHAAGFGDSYLFLRYCPFEEKGFWPTLNALFQVKFPSGKFQHAAPDKLGTDLMGATSGGGSYDHGYGIILTKKLKPFLLHADVIYSFPTPVEVDGVKTRYANYFNYDFSTEYFFLKNFNLCLELNGFLQGDRRENSISVESSGIDYLNMAFGIGWSCKKVQTLLAYQRSLVGTNVDANDSVIFTLVYNF
jgi:hypothetical protein